MFDEDPPKPKTSEFPRNMDNMSIEELKEYIGALQEEIHKAEADIQKKEVSRNAAASIFKS